MPPTVQLSGVEKTYVMGDVSVRALRGIDLRVERGEMVAIMGSSGSGKSTLLNLLGCLDTPTAGLYRLEGRDVAGLGADARADLRNQLLGFVFQGFHLLPRTTALENVELPLLYGRDGQGRHARERAAEALARVGLADRMDHVPNQLSGGQQQRVAIARALVNGPALLLADEPTGNLDSRTSIEILALFQELHAAGMTLLVVTHEREIAAYAERVVELHDGLVRRDGRNGAPRSASGDLVRVALDAVA